MKDPVPSVVERDGEAVSIVRWLVPLVLFSVWPFIHFANQNKHESFDPLRLAVDATVYLVIVSCLVVIVGLMVPRRRFGQIASVVAIGTVVLFTYGIIETALLGFGEGRPRYPLITWSILAFLVLFLTWRLSRHGVAVRVLTVAAVAMIILPTTELVLYHGQTASKTPVTMRLKTTLPAKAQRKPNIYFFVLDQYGRSDQLHRVTGFDNTPFLRQLETQGFFIADQSLANYGTTDISIPATLSMDYIVKPGDTVPSIRHYSHLHRGHNNVVRRFHSLGYAYAHAQSGRWTSNCGGNEDYCIVNPGRINRIGNASEVEIQLLSQTPILAVMHGLEERGLVGRIVTPRYIGVTDIMDALPVTMRQPFFLFSHILAPHAPYRYQADCSPRPLETVDMLLRSEQGGSDIEKSLYLDNLRCINRQVTSAVSRILANDPHAIVIFQADHGTGFTVDFKRTISEWNEAQILERYGILNVIRFPPECRDILYPSFSPVNTFRLVFSCIGGQPVDLLPDRVILVTYGQHEALLKS